MIIKLSINIIHYNKLKFLLFQLIYNSQEIIMIKLFKN